MTGLKWGPGSSPSLNSALPCESPANITSTPWQRHNTPCVTPDSFSHTLHSLSPFYASSLVPPLPLSLSPSLSVSLSLLHSPMEVKPGVPLVMKGTVLTSMTFFSCLARHQTPTLRGHSTLQTAGLAANPVADRTLLLDLDSRTDKRERTLVPNHN